MGTETIVLVGTPDTGKTNLLGRMWEALRNAQGRLTCPVPPDHIKYLEDALDFILVGEFAPRSNPAISESRSDITLLVRPKEDLVVPDTEILVPDVTGELWKRAVETSEVPADWLRDLQNASGAMLFVRVHSREIVAPLDWVSARKILRNPHFQLPEKEVGIPTQVQLCELVRFLALSLKPHENGDNPRVAVVLTAYDRLDEETQALGPSKYLAKEYPLFAGKLAATAELDIKVFGASIVGGDLKDDKEFRKVFLKGDIGAFGYTIVEDAAVVQRVPDITLPLAWLVIGN